MAYPVSQLIAEAFYTSGIVSREFQTVSGDQEETGLLKLNEILTDSTIEDDMIPYYTPNYNFVLVPGQERYFIPNLTKLETFTFFIDTVRYSADRKQQDRYFGSARAENINSLPFSYNVERTPGGSYLFLYFFPQSNYPAQITGWFSLNSVTAFQDLMSPTATANLGTVFLVGTGTIPAGQIIINGHDFAGSYANPTALATAITNALAPNVVAALSPNFAQIAQYPNFSLSGQLTLTGLGGNSVNIVTAGLPSNQITFGNYSLVSGALNQTFAPMQFDQFYINYLQYRLAERLCTAWNFIVPPGVQKQLLMYQQMISKRSAAQDLSINKVSTLTDHNTINYAQVNLGHGWTT